MKIQKVLLLACLLLTSVASAWAQTTPACTVTTETSTPCGGIHSFYPVILTDDSTGANPQSTLKLKLTGSPDEYYSNFYVVENGKVTKINIFGDINETKISLGLSEDSTKGLAMMTQSNQGAVIWICNLKTKHGTTLPNMAVRCNLP